jgi:hypothetical protein
VIVAFIRAAAPRRHALALADEAVADWVADGVKYTRVLNIDELGQAGQHRDAPKPCGRR